MGAGEITYNLSTGGNINALELKSYLASENIIIDGFNDDPQGVETGKNIDTSNIELEQLKMEIEELKQLLKKSEDEIIDLAIDVKATENNLNKVKIENEKLKVELLEKDQTIKALELIQTTEDKSKLGSTRAENNVSKLILALSAQAKIDISKPYAQYESLKTQAELLGIDKFPSDENVASWLKRANFQNPNKDIA